MTDEHVLGKWTRGIFPTRGRYEVEKVRPDGTISTRSSLSLVSTWIAHAVCSPCNSGWMNDRIEVPAQRSQLPQLMDPFIPKGMRFRITPPEQRALAIWAAKVALLFPYTDTDFPSGSDPRHLRAFYLSHRPPRGHYIWIGAFVGRGRSYAAVWRNQPMMRAPGEIESLVTTLTFHVGHVAFRVFQGPFRSPFGPLRPDPINGPWFRIWPRSGRTLDWPMQAMTREALAYYGGSIPTSA